MKTLNTFIALVLVVALGGILFYLNRHPAKAPTDANAKQKLFSFQADQLKEFTIETPDQPAVTIRRAAKTTNPPAGSPGTAQWEVVSPAGVAGDNSEIQSFVEALPKQEYTPLEAQTPASLGEYGLDHPVRTLKLQPAQGQPVTLLIGKENPGGSSKYAMLSSSPGLFLLDTYENKDLEKTLYDLRDKRILPISGDKVQRVELRFDPSGRQPAAEIEKGRRLGLPVKPPKIVMTKQANGNWELTDPAVRTSTTDANYFVTAVGSALMKAVESENPKSLSAYGLDRPQIRVEVTTADGTHSLLVGKKKEDNQKPGEAGKAGANKGQDVGYYAKNSDWPVVFTIHDAIFDQLNQDLDTYRNRSLFDFESPDAARRIEIQGPQGELRLDKKDAEWFKAGATPTKVDASKVNAWLEAVHMVRIQHFTEDKAGHLAEYGLQKPWMTVKVTYGEANKEETVLFGQKNKKFYGARTDGSSVYELGPNDQETVESKLKELSQ